jgi:16S rRNA (guanine1516-N2)-methyltransferase
MRHSDRYLFYHPDAADLAARWRDDFLLSEQPAPPAEHPQPYLWAVDDHLELHAGGDRPVWTGGIWISSGEVERRAAQGGELARACGVSGTSHPHVLDVMAGWGIDGLVLVRRGCRATMVERQPLVAALQQDLLRRVGTTAAISRCGDGFDALTEAGGYDVVYLDPMFPSRAKRALPGKRLQALAELAEPDARPLSVWLQAAVAAARHRVVLKRRARDPSIGTPDWQIRGRTVRFDVYRGILGVSAPAEPRSGSPGR